MVYTEQVPTKLGATVPRLKGEKDSKGESIFLLHCLILMKGEKDSSYCNAFDVGRVFGAGKREQVRKAHIQLFSREKRRFPHLHVWDRQKTQKQCIW